MISNEDDGMRMIRRSAPWLRSLIKGLMALFGIALALAITGKSQAQWMVQGSGSTVPEGNDFATRVLRDPWDMSEFSDVSQWLNHTAPEHYLSNIQVQDGVFSAHTLGSYSEFFLLFHGYPQQMIAGKIGPRLPISSDTYSCLYFAMNVQSPMVNVYQVRWSTTDVLEGAVTQGIVGADSDTWKLYFIDLANASIAPVSSDPPIAWNERQEWNGLRIRPTNQANIDFYVDWARLTDCQPVNFPLTALPPTEELSIWVGTGSPERQILVLESFVAPSGSYNWDIQGLAAGTYTYYVKSNTGGNTVQQGQLTVNAAPIAHFSRPSPQSGIDHPTSAGNPWDMNDANDVVSVECTNWSFANGLLVLDTPMPSQLPPGCVGSGATESDPRIYLRSGPTGISFYRYFSFRLLMEGDWPEPDKGMIVRWIWELQPPGGGSCTYVSNEIALDIGWHTYEIDLRDDWNGMPVEGTCALVHWNDQEGLIVKFRFDPNENIDVTGVVFHQELDWVRLTRIDRVTQGQPFPVQVSFNKPPGGIATSFYYTSDPVNDPFQQSMNPYSLPPVPEPGPYAVYLPVIMRDLQSVGQNLVWFKWDTAGVTPYDDYYVCVQADDGFNPTTYCSTAPMEVVAP